MKPIQFSKFLVFTLIATVAVAGCRKTPVKVTDINGPSLAGTRTRARTLPEDLNPAPPITSAEGSDMTRGFPLSTNPNEGAATVPVPIAPPEGFAGYTEDPVTLKSDAVYFDFDSSVVKAGEKTKVPHVADYLKDHPAEKVRIAGNCDERGTEEYNRALGERRALALREELLRLGMDPLRIDTVSYGKDKPVAPGHDESAWRQNRRGDFVVLLPPPAP